MFSLYDAFMKYEINFRVYKKTLKKWATHVIYSRIERQKCA